MRHLTILLHVCALVLTMHVSAQTTGDLYGMGVNSGYRMGSNIPGGLHLVPTDLGIGDVTKMAAGLGHTIYLDSNGTLWGVGGSLEGQLGFQGTASTPVQIATNVVDMAAGDYHTVYLDSNGAVWTMGRNAQGEIGDGTQVQRFTPYQVIASGGVSVAANARSTLYADVLGNVYGMGENTTGQFDPSGVSPILAPTQLALPEPIVRVVLGIRNSFYLTASGTLYGTGFYVNSSAYIQIGVSDVLDVSAGTAHILILRDGGRLEAAGTNSYGAFGDPAVPAANVSAPYVIRDSGVTAMVANYGNTMFVADDGVVYGCGRNELGQLGVGYRSYSGSMPVRYVTRLIGQTHKALAVNGGIQHGLILVGDEPLAPGFTITTTADDPISVHRFLSLSAIPQPYILETTAGLDEYFSFSVSTGYHVDDVIVDGVSQGPLSEYTFTDVQADHTMHVVVGEDFHTISAFAGLNGTITPYGDTVVADGDDQAYTFSPSNGYKVADVFIDGVSQGPSPDYTFVDVQTDHEIVVIFEPDTLTVTASIVGSGTATLDQPSPYVVTRGDDLDIGFSVAPDSEVVQVMVNGVPLAGVDGPFTLADVQEDTDVVITVDLRTTFFIEAFAWNNGSIDPEGTIAVPVNTDQTFTFTPDPDYRVAYVTVDGVNQGSPSSYTFTNVTADHQISVQFELDTFFITATAGPNAWVTPSGQWPVLNGADQTFTFGTTAGYRIADVVVDGVSQGPISQYTFTNVTAAHTIHVTAEADTVEILATAGANGSIDPSGSVLVQRGWPQAFTFTPDPSYRVQDVILDGVSLGPIANLHFPSVDEPHTLHVTFEPDIYLITPSQSGSGSGSITPDTTVQVNGGDDLTVAIAVDPGSEIVDVLVDGVSVGATASYTFVDVQADHSIVAVIDLIPTYTITASAGANGDITPSGTVALLRGDDQTFTFTSDPGFRVADVLVDGASQGPSADYTFNAVNTNHTIQVTFEPDTFVLTPVAAGAGSGTISPDSPVTVQRTADQAFLFDPAPDSEVTDVLVDGVSVGNLFTYEFTNVQQDHTLTVVFGQRSEFIVSALSGAGGSVGPPGDILVPRGADVTISIMPDPGMKVKNVFIDGVDAGPSLDYTFTNVLADHVLQATFETWYVGIQATAGAGGTISPQGNVQVVHGQDQTFTITPDESYRVLDVVVDGVSQGPLASYTFTDVQEPHTISATFELDTFMITPSLAGTGSGTIAPDSPTEVNRGETLFVDITVDAGSELVDVLVDGVSVGPVYTYEFANVQADHSIVAVIDLIPTYTITATAGANGAISPSGTVVVQEGNDQAFSFTPAADYRVADVLVDGVSQGAIASYTFTDVQAAHTISVSFELDTFLVTPSVSGTGSGTISPAAPTAVLRGDDLVVDITPAADSRIVDVLIDGVSVGAVSTYTFTDVQAAHSIAAVIDLIPTYTVSATAGPNGNISPSGDTVLQEGSDLTLTITPDTNYDIVSVTVDGVEQGPVTQVQLTNIQANATVVATFAVQTVTVQMSIEKPDRGTVTPSDAASQDVPVTGMQWTVTPNPGKKILSISVNGVEVTGMTTDPYILTLSAPAANDTIEIRFR